MTDNEILSYALDANMTELLKADSSTDADGWRWREIRVIQAVLPIAAFLNALGTPATCDDLLDLNRLLEKVHAAKAAHPGKCADVADQLLAGLEHLPGYKAEAKAKQAGLTCEKYFYFTMVMRGAHRLPTLSTLGDKAFPRDRH